MNESNLCYKYKDRQDRQGSNFMIQIGVFLMSKKENKPIWLDKNIEKYRYINNLFFLPIKRNMELSSLKNPVFISVYGGMRGSSAQFVIKHKQDIVSYFYENYRNDYFEIVKKEAQERNYELPWKNNDDAICFHLRFEDMGRAKDINSVMGFSRYIKWIENGKFVKEFTKCPSDYQCPINITLFEKKIKELKEKYPTKQIYVITMHEPPGNYLNIIKKYTCISLSKNREDYDCWLMANCHTLVMTKSTFPIVPAFYFQGKEIHYQIWPRWASLGIGSKYDKSGWIGFN
jgi:hypothetical protein